MRNVGNVPLLVPTLYSQGFPTIFSVALTKMTSYYCGKKYILIKSYVKVHSISKVCRGA